MRRFQTRTDIEEEPSINLTPLIDVVFVILIMFIVIAPLLESDRVSLAPTSSHPTASTPNPSPITLHVHADETLRLNGNSLSFTQLLPILQNLAQEYPQATPQLFYDQKATFGTYQKVKQAVEAAGFKELEVLLKPQ